MKGAARIGAQIGITAGLLGLLLWRSDVGAVAMALRRADWRLAPVAVLLIVCAKLCQGVRWWLLVRQAGAVPLRAAVLVLLAGVGVGILLPFRAGAAFQLQVLHRRYGVERVAVAGTLMGEGLIDAILMLVLVLIAVPLLGLQQGIVVGALAGAAVLAALVGGVLLLSAGQGGGRWLCWLPARPRGFVQTAPATLRRGMQALGQPRTVGLMTLLTAADWLLAAIAHLIVGAAFGLGVPPYAYLAVEIVGNASAALPLTAGSVGPYEVATRETLVLFGADGARAAAFALGTHATIIVAEVVSGLFAISALRLRRTDLW